MHLLLHLLLRSCSSGNDPNFTTSAPALGVGVSHSRAARLCANSIAGSTAAWRPSALTSDAGVQAMESLHLQTNVLTGSLPAEWAAQGRWPNLTSLDLFDNVLAGTIPVSWGAPETFPELHDV